VWTRRKRRGKSDLSPQQKGGGIRGEKDRRKKEEKKGAK